MPLTLTLHDKHDNLDVLDELLYMLEHPIPKWTKHEIEQNSITYLNYLIAIEPHIAENKVNVLQSYHAITPRYLIVVMTNYKDPSKIIVSGYPIRPTHFDQMMDEVATFMKNLALNGFVIEANPNILKQLYGIETIINENSTIADNPVNTGFKTIPVLNMMNQPQCRRELATIDLNVSQQADLRSLMPSLYQQITSSTTNTMPKFEKELRTLLTFCLLSSKCPMLMRTHQ